MPVELGVTNIHLLFWGTKLIFSNYKAETEVLQRQYCTASQPVSVLVTAGCSMVKLYEEMFDVLTRISAKHLSSGTGRG